MVKNKSLSATLTLSGAIIGAGILGLPYAISKAGFIPGLILIILLSLLMLFINLALGEVILRTSGTHQLVGLARIYLGKNGKKLMFFAVIFGIYSALVAYLIGEGESLSQLIFGSTKYAIFFGLLFWMTITLLLRAGLRGVRKIATYGVIAAVIVILGIFIFFLPQINIQNLQTINYSNLFFPIGTILFALLGFTAIPELRREINKQEGKLKKAIIIGTLIPVVLYILFTLTIIGVLGTNIQQVATLSFGPIVTLLGIFTMFSSYFVHSFILREIYRYDLEFKNSKIFLLVSFFPLALYLLISVLGIFSFITILGIGGTISGGATGILILIMNKKSKSQGKRKPEYQIPLSKIAIYLLSIIFIIGIILEIVL